MQRMARDEEIPLSLVRVGVLLLHPDVWARPKIMCRKCGSFPSGSLKNRFLPFRSLCGVQPHLARPRVRSPNLHPVTGYMIYQVSVQRWLYKNEETRLKTRATGPGQIKSRSELQRLGSAQG